LALILAEAIKIRYMKYKSSLTGEMKLAILFLFLFWLINTLVIISSNGIRDAVESSVLMIIFAVVFVLAFVKGIYVVMENAYIKNVHMFFLKETANIEKITKVQMGLMGGLYKSILLVYSENGREKNVKIGITTFKKDILKQLISDLKNQNNNIEIDESVNKFFSK